jgi:hypothetical protein
MPGQVPLLETSTTSSRSGCRPTGEAAVKLYRNAADLQHWTVYLPESGWFCFPAAARGWDRRVPAANLDPIQLQEVPVWLAFNTGLLETRRASARHAA